MRHYHFHNRYQSDYRREMPRFRDQDTRELRINKEPQNVMERSKPLTGSSISAKTDTRFCPRALSNNSNRKE